MVVTSGDPTGIGPEVILKALIGQRPRGVRAVIVGDLPVFEAAARRLRIGRPRWSVVEAGQFEGRLSALMSPADRLRGELFVDCGHAGPFRPGRSGVKAGAASLAYLRTALACVRRIPASLVTGPVTKWAIEESGQHFTGHTEFLAEAFGARQVVMMFVSQRLRLVLLTRHLPLRRVSAALSASGVRRDLVLTATFLRDRCGVRRPRLALCGLNPHAGEQGRLGREEQRLLIPALRLARQRGLRIDGPFAADGFFGDPSGPAFHAGRAGGYDAVVCCYHDQGLIPFKLMARDQGCQVTIGLPVVRTSPDHGSGLDIAGKNLADAGSMRYAIRLAACLMTK
ncbi:MAG: 4-hydroxythreonine-4-phosphate dehydrogenase PdxA [Candidatus Omnitrophica bacterium]|nr:4-hydroxythreonine-4-phosphate dehydrogenase PdxA [Candidatus Omnitrophota bacterium]